LLPYHYNNITIIPSLSAFHLANLLGTSYGKEPGASGKVMLNLTSSNFTPALTYVAVSRVRSLQYS